MAQKLSNLPIGAKIKFGKHSINGETAQDIIWTIVAKNHTGYPSNSVTLLTSRIIDLRAFDAREPNSNYPERRDNGNNQYDVSNIDQWLNKSESKWFVAAHDYDQAPDYKYISGWAESDYTNRPGFLSNFTEDEIAAILSTPITFAKYNNSLGSATRKIFLASAPEVGYDGTDGTKWEYFNSSTRDVGLTTQCIQNVKMDLGDDVDENTLATWLLRSALPTSPYIVGVAPPGGIYMSGVAASHSEMGVRPAMNLSSTQKVSDTTDSDGCYTVIYNTAPHSLSILPPKSVHEGVPFAINLSAKDDEGDALSIEVQRALGAQGDYFTIYSGAWKDSITDIIQGHKGVSSCDYRFRAIDTTGNESEWAYSSMVRVILNNAPVISVPSGNITIQNNMVDFNYTVSDVDNDIITITEMVNDQTIRSYTATGSSQSSFVFNTLKLPNGTHTITITAADSIDTTTKTLSFVKSVSSLMVQNDPPYIAIEMPTRIKVSVTRNIPEMAVFKVEVCNNAYDSTPVWEDATSSVISGLNHIFTNTKKESGKDWGVRIRVTVDRNGGSGACYVSAIGGNFE